MLRLVSKLCQGEQQLVCLLLVQLLDWQASPGKYMPLILFQARQTVVNTHQ